MTEPSIPPRTAAPDAGWDWFDQAADKVRLATEADGINREDIANAYRAVFATPQGRIVRDHLMRFVTRVATFDPALGALNGAAYGFYREGQNSIVIYIDKMSEARKDG